MDKPRVSIVAAIGAGRSFNGGLGKDGKLLWHIPDDLKRFKALTVGHPVIMGRKTFESIVAMISKPLPGRTNIVVTRDNAWQHDGVLVYHSFEDALQKARELDTEEVHIGGGAQLYEQALPYVDRLYLTLVEDEKEADTFFPAYEHIFTKKISEESQEFNGLRYRWVTLEK